MVYEHKILETYKIGQLGSLNDYTIEQLDEMSKQGWELISAISEFKFLFRRPIEGTL